MRSIRAHLAEHETDVNVCWPLWTPPAILVYVVFVMCACTIPAWHNYVTASLPGTLRLRYLEYGNIKSVADLDKLVVILGDDIA